MGVRLLLAFCGVMCFQLACWESIRHILAGFWLTEWTLAPFCISKRALTLRLLALWLPCKGILTRIITAR